MNIGWQYLILFGILTAPFVFWVWHEIGKTIEEDTYKDEFDRCQEKADFNCYL